MEVADIVIVGGGVMGVSIAHHLASAGAGSVRLLEKRFVGAGQIELTMFGEQAVEPLSMMPAERAGVVFWCNACGTMSAIDALTGEVEWLTTYDTIALHENLVGDAKDYLVENLGVQVLYADGKAVQLEMPASVSLKVIESAAGVRGDTASNVTKPAKLETGKTINVPLFIKEGESIKIDTRTGAYMGRA